MSVGSGGAPIRLGVLVLNFGEPARSTLEEVVPFLERIFMINADLEGASGAAERSRTLAQRRAPGLIEEYERIGGSPLNRQAREQADRLQAELGRRGYDARCYTGMQFTEPRIADAVERARADGADLLIALPVFPVSGPSTNLAALGQVERAVDDLGWDVPTREISGWHRHPEYIRLRADGIIAYAAANRLDLTSKKTLLVFSAHGTPVRYLEQGSRYQEYTEDSCRDVAAAAGVRDYRLGYQNHTNRPVEWTQPDVAQVIDRIAAEGETDDVLVVPISFMHEQSETLSELDIVLRQEAEERGLRFHRVPVPHDDPRLALLLADLIEPLAGGAAPAGVPFGPCRCRPRPGTFCTNVG